MSDQVEEEMRALHEAAMASRPDPSKSYERGTAREHMARRRAERMASNKTRVTARFDADVVERFKELAGEGSYQALMNRALRQWLDVKDIRQMLREELREQLREALERERPAS